MRQHKETSFDCDVKHEERLNKRLMKWFPHRIVFYNGHLSLQEKKESTNTICFDIYWVTYYKIFLTNS